MTATRVTRLIKAPRARVYDALIDPAAVACWKVPAGMTCHVHEFEAREGGALRISLTYDDVERSGKTGGRTDTYHGRFVRLVPHELVVEADEFETADRALRGEMTITSRWRHRARRAARPAAAGHLAGGQRGRLARGAGAARSVRRVAGRAVRAGAE